MLHYRSSSLCLTPGEGFWRAAGNTCYWAQIVVSKMTKVLGHSGASQSCSEAYKSNPLEGAVIDLGIC